MYLVRKEFKFEAAHQLRQGCFTAACSDCIHGHSYRVEVCMESSLLDTDGMVVDFGRIKEEMKVIIDRWDHALILPREIAVTYESRRDLKKLIGVDWNPTAENMARAIFNHLHSSFYYENKFWVKSVRVWETATSSAEVTKDDEGI